MGRIVTKLKALFELEGKEPPSQPDLIALTPLVLEKYGFLPKPITVQIEGDSLIIDYPDEQDVAKAEASKLAERAARRAAEGDYQRAISLWKKVLEAQPSLHSARRDLAMAYVEVGDKENAKNNLIEVLRLDPCDAWSYVVLANLYVEQDDYATSERFLKRALELKPDDAWALNSLAAVNLETDRSEEGMNLFRKAIAANPDFANPYFGLALALHKNGQPEEATKILAQLFGRAKMQDARSRPVFEQARELFTEIQRQLAEKQQDAAFREVENMRASVESLFGYPVKVSHEEFSDRIGATIQMAWKHGRDYHALKLRESYPEILRPHLTAHELSHLRLECEARKAGKNLFFSTTAKTREFAIRSVADHIRQWQRQGYDEKTITQVTLSLVQGLCGFLFNCPIDMIIETALRRDVPVLAPSQFLSVRLMAEEAWDTNANPKVRELMPRNVMRASLALNGAYALFIDSLFERATNLAARYRETDSFGVSEKLWQHWQTKAPKLSPGDEYKLVDEFADMLRLREWYEWRPDPGTHTVDAPPVREGTTNPELLRQKHMPAVMFLLGALQRYDKMPLNKVKEVTLEIALLGRNGLDYASPDQKYRLKSLPDESFSGLHLMCLMFAGFKRFAPEHDVGMDLHEPFLLALQMHNSEKDKK